MSALRRLSDRFYVTTLAMSLLVSCDQTSSMDETGAVLPGSSQTGELPASLELLSPSTVRLGEVRAGGMTTTELQWSIRNRSAAEVTIAKVAASCGCVNVTIAPGRVMKPGDHAEVRARFSPRRLGPFRESVRIATSTGESLELAIVGDGVPPAPRLELDRAEIRIDDQGRGRAVITTWTAGAAPDSMHAELDGTACGLLCGPWKRIGPIPDSGGNLVRWECLLEVHMPAVPVSSFLEGFVSSGSLRHRFTARRH